MKKIKKPLPAQKTGDTGWVGLGRHSLRLTSAWTEHQKLGPLHADLLETILNVATSIELYADPVDGLGVTFDANTVCSEAGGIAPNHEALQERINEMMYGVTLETEAPEWSIGALMPYAELDDTTVFIRIGGKCAEVLINLDAPTLQKTIALREMLVRLEKSRSLWPATRSRRRPAK